MESSVYPDNPAPLLSFQSHGSPHRDFNLISDNEYVKGFLSTADNAAVSPAVSMTSGSTEFSYAQPQGISDSVFKPIREVLAEHQGYMDTHAPEKEDCSSEHIQSEAMVKALKALQSKIARLEAERAAAAEKFEALSSRTSQKQLELIESPIRHLTQDSNPPYAEPISVSELRSSSLHDLRIPQSLGFDRYEVDRRIDSINDKCWKQSQELEITRDMLRRADMERKHTEDNMLRLERKYDELRASSDQTQPPSFQTDPALLAKQASEEAVRRVEERQWEMASTQQRTEESVRELQHELKLEQHRRKLLQEKAAELQASQDSSLAIVRAASLPSNPSNPRVHTRPKKKRVAGNKLSKHSQNRAPSTEGDEHYRVQLKDIPFVVGTSTSQSYSVGANYQQLLSLLKSHNSNVCGRRGAKQGTGKCAYSGRVKPDRVINDSTVLIEELERELGGLQIQHQHLARELQLALEEPTQDSEQIEQALRELLYQMDVKAQHVRLARTVSRQVNSKGMRSPDPPSSVIHSEEISTVTTSPPVNLYSNVPLPASNITALRALRNIQSTLKEEDLRWN